MVAIFKKSNNSEYLGDGTSIISASCNPMCRSLAQIEQAFEQLHVQFEMLALQPLPFGTFAHGGVHVEQQTRALRSQTLTSATKNHLGIADSTSKTDSLECVGEHDHFTQILFVHSTRQQSFTEILQRFHIVLVGQREHVLGELVNCVHQRELVV